MGGSLPCLMADVLMNHLVDKALSRTLSNHKPSILYRYVDDCFTVFDSLDSIKIFCDSLNEVHPNIKFTTEIQNNKCIYFLDVLVDNSSTTVTTSTFRKPTNTGLYSIWSSFEPRRYVNITWSIVCSIVLTRFVVLMKTFVQRWIISKLCLVAMAILLIF